MDGTEFTSEGVAAKLGEIFDPLRLGSLTRHDIGIIETYRESFAKYVNAYRVSLLVQKAYDFGHEAELSAKINLCSDMLKEITCTLEQKRVAYDEKMKAEELQKADKGV